MIELSAKAEATVGGVLIAAPWWVYYLAEINVVASTVAAILGVIVGARAVYRIYKEWRGGK